MVPITRIGREIQCLPYAGFFSLERAEIDITCKVNQLGIQVSNPFLHHRVSSKIKKRVAHSYTE